MAVTYRMAHSGGEYNRLYALMRREDGVQEPIGWPVVVAVENEKVIGFLGTWPTEEALIAGPLVIEGSKRMFVLIRLVEAYENVLRAAGVTKYLFTVEKTNTAHLRLVESLNLEKVRETDASFTFVREL